jgi:hypothetical protein
MKICPKFKGKNLPEKFSGEIGFREVNPRTQSYDFFLQRQRC